MKKALTWLFVIFLIYFVVSRPTAAAGAVKGLFGHVAVWGEGLGTFFQSVVS